MGVLSEREALRKQGGQIGMRTRLYLPGTADARVLDRLLEDNRRGDVLLEKDRIVVSCDDNNCPTGCLVWRPCAFIHEFHVPPVLGQRSIAAALYDSAVRLDIRRRHLIRQAFFMIDRDNCPMLRYARGLEGAVEQDGIIFLLDLKAPGATTYEGNGQAR